MGALFGDDSFFNPFKPKGPAQLLTALTGGGDDDDDDKKKRKGDKSGGSLLDPIGNLKAEFKAKKNLFGG